MDPKARGRFRALERALHAPETPARDKPGIVEKMEQLERGETSGLAERVDAIEESLSDLSDRLGEVIKRLNRLDRPGKGPLGFGKSD